MDHFDTRSHIQFAGNPTRSGTSSKLVRAKALQSSHHHFYFNRNVRLWNHLPEIDTSFSQHNQKSINCISMESFTTSFNSDSLCSYHILRPCYRCSRQLISVNFLKSLTHNHDFQPKIATFHTQNYLPYNFYVANS